MTTKQAVEIVGPNLNDQSTGDFHVHAKGCADLSKAVYHNTHRDWFLDAESNQHIVEDIYEDMIFSNDEDPWEWFEGDVHIFPCVHLPRLTKVEA